MGIRFKVFDQATTDNFVNSTKAKVLNWGTKLIYIKNNHGSNGVTYQIIAEADSRDTTDSTHTLLGSTNISAGGTIIYKTTDPWDVLYVKLQNQTGGNNATAVAWINGGINV